MVASGFLEKLAGHSEFSELFITTFQSKSITF
jgi:hypothetical protein